MEITLIMRFFSQMAILCHVGTHIKLLTKKIHVDSHAENDKAGSENEGEIGEKLNKGHHKNLTGLLWSSGMQWRQTHKYTLNPYLLRNEISRGSTDRRGRCTYFTIDLMRSVKTNEY